MNFLNKLEKKMGWMAIGNLPLYIVTTQGIVYVWMMFNPDQVNVLLLDPVAVVRGHEVWRLLTFLFITPVQNPIFAFFFLYILYIYSVALEQEWGSFPFTLFYLTGVLGTIASAFFFGSADGSFYLNTSIFLAFAALHPDFQLYLFFVLPIKVKWLAWLTWAYFGYTIFFAPLWAKAGFVISLINYFLFFGRHHVLYVLEAVRRYQHRRKYRDLI